MTSHFDIYEDVEPVDPWEPGMEPPCARCGHAETRHDFAGDHGGCHPCTAVSDDGAALCSCPCYFPNPDDEYD